MMLSEALVKLETARALISQSLEAFSTNNDREGHRTIALARTEILNAENIIEAVQVRLRETIEKVN